MDWKERITALAGAAGVSGLTDALDAAEKMLREFYHRGWAVENNGRWSFTPQGYLVSNTLIGMLLEALSNQRQAVGTPWRSGDVDENQSSLFVQPVESVTLFNGIN